MTGSDPRAGDAHVSSAQAKWTAVDLLEQFKRLHGHLGGLLSVPVRTGGQEVAELVTSRQADALRSLAADGLTMRRFAEALGLSRGSATAMADRLLRLGLAERRFNERDRREVHLVRTPRGHRLIIELDRRQRAAVEALANRFVAERIVPVGDCVVELLRLLEAAAEELGSGSALPA